MPEGGSERGKYGLFLTQPQLEAALADLAAGQNAVLGLDQLRKLGFTAPAIRKRAAIERLHRIHRAVYALVPRELLTRDGLYMAAVLACGEGAVLSHRSAAALHGLHQAGGTKIDVTVPTRSRHRHAGIALHRSITLAATDVTIVNHIPCTTVARTLFDLATVLPRRRVERAFDQAEILEVFDLRAIQNQLERNRRRRGAATIQAILAEHYIGSTLTRSELEEAMLALSCATGLPPPEVNVWLDLADGEPPIQVDFMWRAQRLIVETDGGQYHRTHQAFERDRRRDQRLMMAGWRPIRTTWRQVKWRPQELQATILALLAQAPANDSGSPGAVGDPAPPPRDTPLAGGSTSSRRSGAGSP